MPLEFISNIVHFDGLDIYICSYRTCRFLPQIIAVFLASANITVNIYGKIYAILGIIYGNICGKNLQSASNTAYIYAYICSELPQIFAQIYAVIFPSGWVCCIWTKFFLCQISHPVQPVYMKGLFMDQSLSKYIVKGEPK